MHSQPQGVRKAGLSRQRTSGEGEEKTRLFDLQSGARRRM